MSEADDTGRLVWCEAQDGSARTFWVAGGETEAENLDGDVNDLLAHLWAFNEQVAERLQKRLHIPWLDRS